MGKGFTECFKTYRYLRTGADNPDMYGASKHAVDVNLARASNTVES
ncbi:MAG: hypothetical protein JSV20_04235 [Candidatus Bathyarchaeota archaeon]|nr:MAG: hypothetical protein JSV20_04235 [Candidatus Bathyarchaeota archaeon]